MLTIIRRGDALGLLAHGDCEEVWTHSHYELRALVQIAMGGWVAEELFFGQTSTGPAGDLACGDAHGGAEVGRRGHDRVAHLVRRDAARPGVRGAQRRAGPRAAGGRAGRRPAAPSVGCCPGTATWSRSLRDALLDRHELIGDEITAVLEEATLTQQQLLDREESEKNAAVAAGAAAHAAIAAERLRVA